MVEEIMEQYDKLNDKGQALAREAIKSILSNKNNIRKCETPKQRFERETNEVLRMVARGNQYAITEGR